MSGLSFPSTDAFEHFDKGGPPMPTLASRAAAYTRTGILRRFLDQASETLPTRVDNGYVETRLGLKGGDVRAFLQSLRVLGLIDPYGSVTDRARRTRAVAQRAGAMREGLEEAYPELVRRWETGGGMSREEVEDFFKVEYGLSASSAAPAAKLFVDLMQEHAPASPSRAQESPRPGSPAPSPALPGSGVAPSMPTQLPHLPDSKSQTPDPRPQAPPSPPDARIAALDAIKSSLKVEINAEWDEERINLVFDRMERLVKSVLDREPG
jgi:hypothetical protein